MRKEFLISLMALLCLGGVLASYSSDDGLVCEIGAIEPFHCKNIRV